MLTLHLCCMVITLYVLEHYVISGFHASAHRLLPLVLGLIGVYDFYLIVENFVAAKGVLVVLKDLLLMQMIFLLFYYIMDFMRIKLPVGANVVLFAVYTVANVITCTQIGYSGKYRRYMMWFAIVLVGITLVVATWAYFKKQVSRLEHTTYIMLYIAILIPGITVGLVMVGIGQERIIMPIVLSITCLIIDGLMSWGNLMDTESLLKNDTFNTSRFPIVLFDKELFYLDANNEAKELFADILEVIKGKKKGHEYSSYLQEWADNPNEYFEVEIKGHYYNAVMRELFYNHRVKGYFLELYDVTEPKIQVRAKSSFLANMSHDLRSPLHAIIGGSDIMLARSEMSVRNRVLVQHIKKAGENLLEIVNSILDYSKLEVGKLKLNEKEFSLRKLLMEQSEITRINLMDKPIDFSFEVMTEYPEMIKGDDMRIREIIQNLLSNAVKYTEEGRIDCKIWCCRIEDEVEITVQVADTGSGISEEEQKQIFEEYTTYASSKVKESTGLGLSIVYQLASMMGGNVQVESDGKTGTAMTVKFISKNIQDEWLQPELIKNKSISSMVQEWNVSIEPDWIYPEARILVADDMEVNRQIIAEYAEPWQISVDVVADGKQAVDAAREKDYQIIILDLMMPVMDGYEAAREIKAFTNVPVIALSANEVEDQLFDDFIQKPILNQNIREIFENHIPESYKKNPPIANSQITFGLSSSGLEGYYRTLHTYIKELGGIKDELENYMETDINLFRIKVHGIKGISRQLYRIQIAETSEIMEMAAKAGHEEFIKRHIKEYLTDLQLVLQEATQELEEYENSKVEAIFVQQRDEKVIERLKAEITEGFLEYNIKKVETAIAELESYRLSEKEQEQLKQVKTACEEFEYEEGGKIWGRG